MKKAIINLFYVKKEMLLFLYPIIAFYLLGRASTGPIVLNSVKSVALFNLTWILCSIGLCIMFRAALLLIGYILKLIGNLLDKKRD